MRRHTREVHAGSGNKELEEPLMNTEDVFVNTYKCSICDFECLIENVMQRHLRQVHPLSKKEEGKQIEVDLEKHPDSADEVMENIDFILMNDQGFGLLFSESD